MSHIDHGAARLAKALAHRPNSVITRVFANRDNDPNRSPNVVVAQVQAAFEQFKADHNRRVDNCQTALDEINAKFATMPHAGGGAPDLAPPDPEYSRVWGSWFRHGDAQAAQQLASANREGDRQRIQAAMSGGSAADGGYLAPVEWDRKVNKALRSISPMRRLAKIVQTDVRGFSTVWNTGGFASGWVGETAARPQTSTPTLSPLTFMAGEIYANPATTANLIEDAAIDVENWLAESLQEEFAFQEGPAFIAGDGVNKPQGLLTYATGGAGTHPGGAVASYPSGESGGLVADGLLDLVFKLPAPYRQGASWLMNSSTALAASKLKDGQGNYLWRDSFIAGLPRTLAGYPVEIDENMPDIAANAIPVAFGDFQRGYLINDRAGLRILRDPYTNKPFVNFYATKRVGGGLLDPKAFVFLKIAAS